MSVLVEALTLIVPKVVLDIGYPGGTDAYLQALLGLERPPRYICSAEPSLTNTRFYDVDHLMPAVRLLQQHSIIVDDGESFIEAAVIEQGIGPKLSCSWLEWQEHTDGFTYAWRHGTEPGDMAAPEDWTPEQSRRLLRSDVWDEVGRGMRLGMDASGEIWLDFASGNIVNGVHPRSNDSPPGEATAVGEIPLLPIVIEAAELDGSTVTHIDEDTVATTAHGEHARYPLVIRVNDEMRLVVCTCTVPVAVPEHRRLPVAEFASRVNARLSIGSLYVDMDDGEVSSRASIDVESGTLSVKMALNLMSAAVSACELSFEALMTVAFGGAEPKDAAASVLG
jgi:hypothetical protein